MGIPILVIGKSGSGKSTSLRNFDDNDLTIVNVSKKPLPFKKKFTRVINSDSYRDIMEQIYKADTKSIVIDDAGYLITNHFMKKHSATGGGNGVFTLYNELGDYFWNLIEFVKNKLPKEKIVYFIMHEDKNDFGDVKPKTIGKLLDEKVCIEGMFTIALRCMAENDRHFFRTKSDGSDICKTPMEMFTDKEIDNDLKLVDKVVREYYELN